MKTILMVLLFMNSIIAVSEEIPHKKYIQAKINITSSDLVVVNSRVMLSVGNSSSLTWIADNNLKHSLRFYDVDVYGNTASVIVLLFKEESNGKVILLDEYPRQPVSPFDGSLTNTTNMNTDNILSVDLELAMPCESSANTCCGDECSKLFTKQAE